jgi:two-component system response regulator
MKQLPGLPTILLVEDNIDDHEAALRSFKAAHINNPVHWCKTGKDALDYLRHEGDHAWEPRGETPALILHDLNMPGLDGRNVLAIAKQDPRLKKIPIVVLTISGDDGDVTKCYELGANTYIQKPVDFEGLIEAVRRIKDYWFGTALLPGAGPWNVH